MTSILVSFFLVLTLIFLINYRKVGEVYLPLMILIDMPVAFIVYNEIPQLGLLFNILRLLIVGWAVVKYKIFKKLKRPLLIYIIFAIYLFLVGEMFSSNFEKTFETTLQFLIGIFGYFIGLNLGQSKMKLKTINKYLILSILILIVNILISQFLKIGRQAYSENSIFLGFSNIQAAYLFTYFIAVFGITSTYLKTYNKSVLIFIYSLSFISCILYFRRGAILAMFLSILIILFYKSFNIKKIAILFVGIVMAGFLYQNNFGNIQESFDKRTSHNIDEESRNAEVIVFMEDLNKNPEHFFFGNELFNSQDYLQVNYLFPFSFHTDYLAILHGSGILGFIMIIYFLYSINRNLYKNIRGVDNGIDRKTFYRTQLALIVSFLIISISGQFYSISSLSFYFLYIGLLTSHTKHYAYENSANWMED